MPEPLFERVALVGIGLIGSSLAHVIRREGLAGAVAISTRSATTLARAEELRLGDEYHADPKGAVAGADLVIVSVHAGKEYKHVPAENLAKIYRGWVDAGADLVIGHHPHVIRPVEVYKEGLILHSLGNYVFASRTVRYRKFSAKMYGLVTRVVIQDGRVAAVELVPTWVNNSSGWKLPDGQSMPNANFAPRLVTGDFADAFFEDFNTWTTEAGATPVKRHNDVGRIELPAPERTPTESAQ